MSSQERKFLYFWVAGWALATLGLTLVPWDTGSALVNGLRKVCLFAIMTGAIILIVIRVTRTRR